jgi:hypothetical protein
MVRVSVEGWAASDIEFQSTLRPRDPVLRDREPGIAAARCQNRLHPIHAHSHGSADDRRIDLALGHRADAGFSQLVGSSVTPVRAKSRKVQPIVSPRTTLYEMPSI